MGMGVRGGGVETDTGVTLPEHEGAVVVFGDSGVREVDSSTKRHTVHLGSDEGDAEPRRVGVGQVACGQQYFAAVGASGKLYTWGLAEGGRLGHGSDLDLFFPLAKPRVVRALAGETISKISCGAFHMLAVTTQGGLYSWGDNQSGQLGLGSSVARATVHFTPQPVTGLFGVTVADVACGSQHSLAVDANGAVYSWGRAKCGRLGRVGDLELGDEHSTPVKVPVRWEGRNLGGSVRISEGSGGCVSVVAGWSHSIAITRDGSVFVWGCGAEGRLGIGSHGDVLSPLQVRALAHPSIRIAAASAGYAHTLFLSEEGAVFSCGYNMFGQLGLNHEDVQNEIEAGLQLAQRTAEEVEEVDDDGEEKQQPARGGSLGPQESEGSGRSESKIHEDGDVVGAGVSAAADEDEAGAEESRLVKMKRYKHVLLVPVHLRALASLRISRVCCGENHTSVMSIDGRVFTWGLNSVNQCGHGSGVAEVRVPQELVAGARSIEAGASHIMIVS